MSLSFRMNWHMVIVWHSMNPKTRPRPERTLAHEGRTRPPLWLAYDERIKRGATVAARVARRQDGRTVRHIIAKRSGSASR